MRSFGVMGRVYIFWAELVFFSNRLIKSLQQKAKDTKDMDVKLSTLALLATSLLSPCMPAAFAQSSMLSGVVRTNQYPPSSYYGEYANQPAPPGYYAPPPYYHGPPPYPPAGSREEYATRYHGYLRNTRSYFRRHPMVKSAAVGAGLGAVAGGVTGLVTHGGFVRGAAIGAGTGAGIGIARSSRYMARHPIARDVATGGLTGLGLSWAASRGWHEGRNVAIATGIGSAIGLGWGMFKNMR
jgi:hypothetical protein